jgi:CubicO group peptidase (beta-lactamase class C family)
LKKVLLVILVGLFICAFWIIEPYSLNPFLQIEKVQIKSLSSYHCEPNNLGQVTDVKTSADAILEKYMLSSEFVGVTTGVYKAKCGTYVGFAGYSDKRGRLNFNPDTITRIASITKPMTAVAIMQLYEQGLIDLDVPLQVYLPNFPESDKKVTVRHLLSHISGVPHYSSKVDAMSFSHYPSLNEAVDSVIERGVVSEPGGQYIYSSFGYTLLGKVIEEVSGRQFDEYLNKNIWQKAGMQNTTLETSHASANKSRLYIKAGPLYVRSPYTDLSVIYPAGGVQSNAEDLLKFGEAILKDKLIARETLEMMIDVTNSLAPEAGDDPYGMGWSVYHSKNYGRIIAHGGAQPGVSAHFQIWLDNGVVSVTLSNAFGTKSSANSLANEIGGLALKAHNKTLQGDR